MTARPYPHSLEAERALLGAALREPSVLLEVGDAVSVDDFYLPDHGALWGLLCEQGLQLDPVTLPRMLDATGEPHRYGGLEYVLELPSYAPATVNADHYAAQVRDLSVRRQVRRQMERAIEQVSTADLETLTSLATAIVDTTTKAQPKTSRHIGAVVDDVAQVLQGRQEAREAGQSPGLCARGLGLDEYMGPYMPGEVGIIAARPGMGKTALMLALAELAASACKARGAGGVLIHGLEMTDTSMVERMVVAEGGLPAAEMRDGKVLDSDWVRICDARDHLAGLPVWIDDGADLSLARLSASVMHHVREHGVRVVFVDYAQLMASEGDGRYDATTKLSRGLKLLAKSAGVAIEVLSQLNRNVESRQDKRPINADLRDSGAWEQDASTILFPYRDAVYNEDSDPKHLELIVGKARYGQPGTVEQWCDLSRMQVGERYRHGGGAGAGPLTEDVP